MSTDLVAPAPTDTERGMERTERFVCTSSPFVFVCLFVHIKIDTECFCFIRIRSFTAKAQLLWTLLTSGQNTDYITATFVIFFDI